MDNSWQSKCSSSWPTLPSSSQLPPQGSRNQMAMNTGHYFHPYAAQEFRSMDSGVIQDPLVFNTIDISSCRSGAPDLGNSFLALLSGPSPHLQCESEQLSSSKPSMDSSKLSMHDSSIMAGGDGCGLPLAAVGLLSQYQGNENRGSGVEHVPSISSRTASSSTCSRISDLHAKLQMGNLNQYNSDMTKPAIHHRVQGNQTGLDLSSPQWGWLAGMNLPSVGQHNTTNVQASMKVPSNRKSIISDHSSAFVSGRPRVFCLATSGDLLLSNTGLLGVVCLCHGSHMSITKFCEHSGLCDVNPGDVVRLESGETVAQWRRLYFLKFGIRVPDDNSGWDWPEGISAACGLVKCKATVPNMSKNSGMLRPIDPSIGSARSGQTWSGFVSPNNSHTGQGVLEKFSNKVVHTPQQRNAQEGCDVLLKSVVGTTHSNLRAHSDIQISEIVKESPMSGGLALSTSPLEKGRRDSGYQSISDYMDVLTKGGNSFISNQGLGNLKFLGTDSDVSRCNGSREAFIMDRDAISSNIELRLGQPSQQSHTLGGSIMSSLRSQSFDALGDCQKSLSQSPLIHNMVNPRVAEDSRPNLQCAPSNTSSNSKRENKSQPNAIHHPPGNCGSLDPDKLEQFRGDMAKSSLVSMLLSRYNNSSERDLHLRSPNMVSNSEPFTARVLHGESHIAKCDPANFRRNINDGMERQLNINGLGFLNHVDKGKGALHISDHCSYMATKTNLFHNKQMADSSPFTGVVSGNHLPSALTVHDKQSSYLGQSAGIIQDASDASNQTNQFSKVSFLGNSRHIDHAFLRPTNSSVIAGAGLPFSAMPMSFSSTNSICGPTSTPTLSNRVSIDTMDENLRLLALRHVLDLSKQGHAVKPEQGRLFSPSTIEMQRRGSSADPLASEELKEGPYLTIKQDASDVVKPLQSCSNCYLDGGIEKPADAAGVSNWCNFSTSSRGIFIRSKELDVQNTPHDSLANKQPLLRLGRTENDTSASGEHEICSQKEPNSYFPGKCSCAVRSICLVGNCVHRGETSVDACNVHVGRMSDNANAKNLAASIFDKGHMIPEDKAISVGRCENLKRQIPLRNDCHTSQWRDVPSKRMGVCNATCFERQAKAFHTGGNVEDQLVDTASKGFNRTEEAESLNEQQMSNVYSGCSAPAVTEVSIEVNNMDSCTVDARDARYVNDLVVDEGSGIQKCWSSDDALDSVKSTETINVSGRVDTRKGGSTSGLSNLSSQGLIDDLRLGNSFILKKVQNRLPAGFSVHENMNHTQQCKRQLKTGKRKRAVKWKKLDASFPPSGLSPVHCDSPKTTEHTELHSHSSRGIQIPSRPNHGRPLTCIYSNGPLSLKRKRSALYSAKTLSWKRDPRGQHDHHQDSDDDSQTQLVDAMNFPRIPKLVGEENLRQGWTTDASKELCSQEMNQVDVRKAAKHHSLGCAKSFSSHHVDAFNKKTKPVVRGNSGIIYNGKLTEGPAKPAKIVSLRTIYKITRRCTVSENEEPTAASMLETKKICFRSNECCDKLPVLEKDRESEAYNTFLQSEDDHPGTSTFETKKARFSRNDVCTDELSMLKKEGDNGGHKTLKHSILHRSSSAQLKSRFKEARKRSLYELAGKGNNPSSSKLYLPKISKCSLRTKLRSHGKSCLNNVDGIQCHTGELCQVNTKSIKERKCQTSILDSDAFCCVCGSSNKDEINCLLECSCCLIRVHQACYGVSKVPKGRWCCRPCRANSKDIACVLCGYKGGAMTRALRSRNIVKSLLKAWNIAAESKSSISIPLSKDLRAELCKLDTSKSGLEVDSVSLIGPITERSPTTMLKMDFHNKTDVIKNSLDLPSNFPVHNSVTAGALDPTITQWVHMVCGLWTPGTRCPNVDTMSTFDVSGASRPPKNVICSLCNRPGGSCVRCRVVSCSVHFHPWCAHQKGLLQSEVEGVDSEKVGFYGRCMLHATPHGCDSNCHPIDTNFESPGNGEFTCARTEGYKGRKKDGFRHNTHGKFNENGGCLVPQEQINAWLHINGQKSSTRGLLKPLASDIEYDCRKEYTRYKQAKAWKHLVVYKSGIHALGLYTSRFISRGAMVVEYVGEIVGLRVADKREIEYQSGRKLQYKSACYFFRIDKEHIIDATRKGGIARFVNHSCLPNCVAKVISVRTEKKVVFFAERDINPGEEITYDYHFNHEDEGKKIPCFCNSKNCRRYLN